MMTFQTHTLLPVLTWWQSTTHLPYHSSRRQQQISACITMITPSGSTFSVDFTDAGGNKVSATVPDTSGYLNLTGSNLLYPWQNGKADYWCITSFYFYADASYTGWDSEKKEAYFYGYYNIWNPFAGETCLKEVAAGSPVAFFNSFTSCQPLKASKKLI